jgi:hypothetical protein
MSTSNSSRSILSLVFTWLTIISLAGFALLAILLAELAESGWVVPNFMQTYLSYREALQNNTGNEFTGTTTAWLFGISTVPVGWDLVSRTVIRYAPLGETAIGFIRRINNVQRKYLMCFHTWLSILALGLGILHLTLSSCAANPFPEWGLILTGILVTTGLLFKWKAVPSKLRKTLYQFHSSLIVAGILLVILYAGHAVMDSG